MVKISRKLENGCRVLVQLAGRHATGGVSPVDELAAAEQVSPSFLLQILNDLRKHGIVASRRGKFGGYQLARHPRDITLAEIVSALEGSLIDPDFDAIGESGEKVLGAFRDVAETVTRELNAATLESIASRESADMFYI